MTLWTTSRKATAPSGALLSLLPSPPLKKSQGVAKSLFLLPHFYLYMTCLLLALFVFICGQFLTRCYFKEERSLLARGLKDTQSAMGLRGCGCRSLRQQLAHISVDQEAMLRQEVGADYKSQGPPSAPHFLQLVPTSERVQISENSAASGTPSIKTNAPWGHISFLQTLMK